MANIQDLKVIMFNAVTFILSFSNIETLLKIILLLVTIGYTATKWYGLYGGKKNEKDEV